VEGSYRNYSSLHHTEMIVRRFGQIYSHGKLIKEAFSVACFTTLSVFQYAYVYIITSAIDIATSCGLDG
jgi:hypothetical protein